MSRRIKYRFKLFFTFGFLLIGAGSAKADRSVSLALHPAYPKVTIEIKGFLADDEEMIQKSLAFLSRRIGEIKKEEGTGDSHFALCTAKYSTKDWVGWDDKQTPERNKINNAYWTYVDTTMAISNHGTAKKPIVIESFSQQDTVVGHAKVGYRPDGVKPTPLLQIGLNSYNFGTGTMSENKWAGTIYHEFLHRVGYRHPNGYPGSLIKEAGLCVARSFADKTTGLRLVDDDTYSMQD